MRDAVLLPISAMVYFVVAGFGQAAEPDPPRAAVYNVKDFGARGSIRLVHDAGKQKHLEGGWTGTRVIDVGAPKHAISNIEIDHLQVMNNGDQWVHASIGQRQPCAGTG